MTRVTSGFAFFSGVITPTDLAELDEKVVSKVELKTVQKCHWEKALAHAKYLKNISFDRPPSPLDLWLERSSPDAPAGKGCSVP